MQHKLKAWKMSVVNDGSAGGNAFNSMIDSFAFIEVALIEGHCI